MMTNRELKQKIQDLIQKKLLNHEEVEVHWACHELITAFPAPVGDEGFFLLCAHEHVQRMLKRAIGILESDSGEPAQEEFRFEGYTYVRKAYSVFRGDRLVLVNTEDLTDSEILERAKLLRTNAAGQIEHAWELEHLVSTRRKMRGGAA